MFPDPDKLNQLDPAEILDAASRGHLGLDHRFLHALLNRPEVALPALLKFSKRDRRDDLVDLAPELTAIFRAWNTTEAIPFLIDHVKEDPEEAPDEVVEALVGLGRPALEPLLALYYELDEAKSGNVAFMLASLGVRDPRLLEIFTDRLDYDLSDTLLLLGIYGDPAAIPSIEKAIALPGVNDRLKTEASRLIEGLRAPGGTPAASQEEPFDVWALYSEKEDLPLELLDEDARAELLGHPVDSVRAAAARSFFNSELAEDERTRLLQLAQQDASANVRARAWESLINSTEEPGVVEPMLAALRNPQLSAEERGGLLVGLAPEVDRNEVREAIGELYSQPNGKAKALEAMWRSMHPSFRDRFAAHLDDPELEVRRGAIWGVGYYGLKGELDRLRTFFDDEELRSDALFAYSLALPGENSRGRMKALLKRVEKDARGLSEMEEELVKAALDERLMLAGKEPVFREAED